MLRTFLSNGGNIILDKNGYTMQCAPRTRDLAFVIKSSGFLQSLGIRLDNSMETSALVVNLQNTCKVRLIQVALRIASKQTCGEL